MPNSTTPKNILLISNSKYHEEIFNELCEHKEFKIYKVIRSIDAIANELDNKINFDLIVFTNFFTDTDVIDYFHQNYFKISEEIPTLFIIKNKLTKEKLVHMEKLKISLIFQEYLTVYFLDYTLKTILQNRKVLRSLKENEFRYKSLYDHAFDINLITNENDMVIDTNNQGRKQLKFEKKFPLRNLFFNKLDFKKFKNLLDEVEQVSRFETELKIQRKTVICLIDAFMLYDNENQKSGAHIVIRNIDADRRSQDLANRASKLLVTGKFLRSLAHEIRNPLTNINLSLEQFNQEISEDDDTKLYVDIIQRSADRIKSLLEDIMMAYKTSEIVLKEESIHNILENSIRFANDRLTLKKINLNLKFKIKDDLMPADKIKLTTAFLNLIVNASESIEHEKGEIKISTSKKDGNFIIKIKDNGCGMNEIQTQALFDPFYTGKSKGLGLGLTTAQNVFFAHKGSINVKSIEGKGTSFIIKLPVKV